MHLNNKEEFMPVEREIKIELEDAPDWCLDVGVIDRIDKVDGETILIEYKSGKFRQGINQELMMYKDLLEYNTDYKVDKVCAIYPKELYGTKLPSGVYVKSPSHEKFARAKVQSVKEAIRKRKWNKKTYNLCAWCDVTDQCFEDEMEIK
jgi:RecB family exonuclease